jgi:hypothetical protein
MILAKEFKGLVRGWLAFVNVGVDTLLSGCHTLVSRSRVRSTHHFLLTKLRVIIHNFTHQLFDHILAIRRITAASSIHMLAIPRKCALSEEPIGARPFPSYANRARYTSAAAPR